MLKKLFIRILLICPFFASGQHTFSIVAVDTITGIVGSAGASCLDTTNSHNINRINVTIPGRGSICAQAQWDFTNLSNAKKRMLEGDSPEEILDWLMKNDSKNKPQRMQYGIADLDDNKKPRTIAFSGSNAMNYKNHIIGPNYTIQGNILIGQKTLDSMELGFLNTPGSFTDKIMGALLGAAFPGADKRCLDEGVSSRSAYIRAARPTDQPNELYLDLYVGATKYGVEPIEKLKEKYDDWNATKIKSVVFTNQISNILLIHDQRKGCIKLKFNGKTPGYIELVTLLGKRVEVIRRNNLNTVTLDISRFGNGCYIINCYKNKIKTGSRLFSLIQ